MATRSISTTELLTAPLPWHGLACALYWSGSIRMDVASVGSEWMMYEATDLDCPACFWVSSQATEWCVHNQETDLSGLPDMWTGISIFVGADAHRSIKHCWRCAA